jgi:hypothetical protein
VRASAILLRIPPDNSEGILFMACAKPTLSKTISISLSISSGVKSVA